MLLCENIVVNKNLYNNINKQFLHDSGRYDLLLDLTHCLSAHNIIVYSLPNVRTIVRFEGLNTKRLSSTLLKLNTLHYVLDAYAVVNFYFILSIG